MAESPLRRVLSDFARIEGVRGIAVVSKDGFVIDAVVPVGGLDLEALAAMVMTVYGASERLGEELRLGKNELITGEYENGIMLVYDIGDAVVAVVAEKSAILGRIRYELKRQAPRIKAAL
ncbi:Roadblock/LC7 family protein [Pyrolobus fumarii 1A]|uniref:Roadblock/LC7 family protein n=1 Tax=Pyrolobus fumarii (strain DSM 11204 / 1A) TaxID=694429 RepID=G0EH72_PYRF1|nr:roadblock/LC7 domain-containing protein [Pyrolobus fumarii]AEM39296.1 Roadblock/LC7 family protein [Pyrolobus fumarii 1A]